MDEFPDADGPFEISFYKKAFSKKLFQMGLFAVLCQGGKRVGQMFCYNGFFCAAVAQLDRVLGYEPRGRGFESCQPRHLFKKH